MMKKEFDMPYVAMISGLLIMCVPEDASLTRFAVQAALGLIIFGAGVRAAIARAEAN